MRRFSYIAFICIILVFISYSFGSRNKIKTSAKEQAKAAILLDSNLTIEEIKKKYPENEIKSIKNIGNDYVLVESEKETFANRFDLYNLKTGNVDTLPTGFEYVTIQKIENENFFIFLASGRNSESPFKQFPYLINCFRIKNDAGMYNSFTDIREDKYFDLTEAVQAGSKSGSIMSDMNISFDGLEVMFKPQKGMESGFYADASDIPPTGTTYDKNKNQMTIQFETDKLGENLKTGIFNTDNNQFISSYDLDKRDNKIILILSLRDTAKKYIAHIQRLPNGNRTDGFPVLKMEFKGSE